MRPCWPVIFNLSERLRNPEHSEVTSSEPAADQNSSLLELQPALNSIQVPQKSPPISIEIHPFFPLCHPRTIQLRTYAIFTFLISHKSLPVLCDSIPRTNANLLLGRRNIVMAFGVLSWVMGMWQGGLSSLQGSGN